jgi:hypothetical protein
MGVREVLASRKPVQVKRDRNAWGPENSLAEYGNWDVLAGTAASSSFSVASRGDWRAA